MMHPFEIVAEPVRRRIIEVLAVGEHPVGILNDVIAMEFSVSRSAVSYHLRILRDEGVVRVEPDPGLPQSRLYVVNGDYLERLDAAVGELFALWEQRYGTGVRRAPQFPARPAPPERIPHAHRPGRRGLRGRGRRDGWSGDDGLGDGGLGDGGLGDGGLGDGEPGDGGRRDGGRRDGGRREGEPF